ncbi:glycosyltransferase [Vibrio splendidus]|uniref:glycosyltransferase n=1 Tax=Vibrio splendidus TaxID=29497 RepID=UPI00076A12D6|nr:glycosyltransferase [Vibrio splendidus]
MKKLINISNLHIGGGIQVAVSFLTDLYELERYDFNIVCSNKVHESLKDDFDVTRFDSFKLLDVFGFDFNNHHSLFDGYDVIFTLFGPFYSKLDTPKHICGFAQAWIAYPKNEAYSNLSFFQKIKMKVKFGVQKRFFEKYDHLVVEQAHVKNALISIGFNSNNISVVSNTISPLFYDSLCWSNIPNSFVKKKFTIGFMGRAYSHKNLKVLKSVSGILNHNFNIDADFVFTLDENEMEALGFDVLPNFYSLGSLTLNQCPSFYDLLDCFVFPSLLECFSVSPLEALKMGIPVAASDRDFVREVCGDAAVYFDPLNEYDIARVISEIFISDTLRQELIEEAAKRICSLPNSTDRTIKYIELMENDDV